MRLKKEVRELGRLVVTTFCLTAMGFPLPLLAQQSQPQPPEVDPVTGIGPATTYASWGVTSDEELDSLFGDYHPGAGVLFVPYGSTRDMLLIDPNTPIREDYFPEESPLTEQQKVVEYFTQHSVGQAFFEVIASEPPQEREGYTARTVAGIWSTGQYVMGVEIVPPEITEFGLFVALQIEDDHDAILASMHDMALPFGDENVQLPSGELRVATDTAPNDGGCDAAAAACRQIARGEHMVCDAGCIGIFMGIMLVCAGVCGVAIWGGPWAQIACAVVCSIVALGALRICWNGCRSTLYGKYAVCSANRAVCCSQPGIECAPEQR